MASQNNETPFVRQCVALWLAQYGTLEMCVPSIVNDLKQAHASLEDIDITKAVSNEMIRLETLGKLTSRVGTVDDGCGIGRPPRLYKKRYCKDWKNLKINA
jgi:hypothetical protein